MSNLLGLVISIALIYFVIKFTFKCIKWIGILLIVVLIVAIVFLGYYVAKKRKAHVA